MSSRLPFTPTPAIQQSPSKFGALAWTALILGIVGVVGSPIIFLNNLTAVVAGVGVILGAIAFFGTKKTLAAIGTALCIAGIVLTVMAQNAAVQKLNEIGRPFDLPGGKADTSAQMLAVGDTYHGSDVDITVADPKAVTTSEYAAPKRKAKAISYNVTVTNHGDKPWSAALLLIQATAGSTAAEQVFDSAMGVDGAPSQDVLPGKSLKFPIAFLDVEAGDISLQVSSMGSDKVYFTHKR